MGASQENHDSTHLIVDSHVHFYRLFSVADVLSVACSNLNAAAQQLGLQRLRPILFWTRSIKEQPLFEKTDSKLKPLVDFGEWSLEPPDADDCSYHLQHSNGDAVTLVEGVQLVSQEGLEVLVIGENDFAHNSEPIDDIISRYKDDKLVILPWGVGKWLGKRGRKLLDIVENSSNTDLFLGDNSGRPWIWSHVAAFNLGLSKNYTLVPGSDPLPIKGEYQKVGSSGVVINIGQETPKSTEEIISLFKKHRDAIQGFGERESIHKFLLNQIMLRINK